MKKPIKVLWSEIGQKWYATQYYKIDGNKITITGEKYDVTQDIASQTVENKITYKLKKKK